MARRKEVIEPQKSTQSTQAMAEERICQGIGRIIGQHFNHPVPMTVSREIYEYVLTRTIWWAIRLGRFLLPPGLGVFKVRRQRPTIRKMPGQEPMEVPERAALRYTEGEAVRVSFGKPDRYPNRRKPLLTVGVDGPDSDL